ncbi:UbiA family prenyltransferase [bacterium]|nr:UbiA family prenyltransferase [bacterium]
MPQNQSQPTFWLKLAALLSIVRWKSVFITALAQYLAFLFAFNNREHFWEALHEYKVHIIIISTILVVAAGYIINSFYDQERDMVNRPWRTRFQLIVSKGFTLNLYLFLNVLALSVAWLASWRIFIFFLVFALLLWFYSHKLSRIVLISEFAATMLSVMAFFSLLLYFQMYHLHFFVYGFGLVLTLLSREIYKDLKSLRGDLLYGYKSIATTLGISSSIRVFQLIVFISLMVDFAVPLLVHKPEMMAAIIAIGALKIISLFLIRYDILKRGKIMHRLLQVLIAAYILGIIWL